MEIEVGSVRLSATEDGGYLLIINGSTIIELSSDQLDDLQAAIAYLRIEEEGDTPF